MAAEEWLRANTLPLIENVFVSGEQAFAVADATAPDLPLLYVNEAFERLTGYALAEVRGRNCRLLQGPETDAADVDAIRAALSEQRHAVVTIRNHRRDGTTFWNRLVLSPVADAEGRVVQFVGALSDVSAQVGVTDRLRAAEERLRRLIESLPLVTYHLEYGPGGGRITSVSPQVEQVTGFAPSHWEGGPEFWMQRMHPDDRARVLAVQAQRSTSVRPLAIEYRMCCANGDVIWMSERDTAVVDDRGRISGRDGFLVDVTALKEAEAALEHQTLHDALTGLPNRRLLLDRLEHASRLAERQGSGLGVLFLDLDGFKYINDSLGHHVGDEVLRALVPRLCATLRDSDVLARFGGDEFVVVCEALRSPEDLSQVAERLLAALREPLEVDGRRHVITGSIGVALASAGQDADTVIRNADAAMYEAKGRGRDRFEVFDRPLRDRIMARLDLETGLRAALGRSEFGLHYQPSVEVSTGRVHAVEALLRWSHRGRAVPPSEFIPLAEQTGMIAPIGEWVLRTACRQLAAWRREDHGGGALLVRVNVAAPQLEAEGFADVVADALASAGLEPEALGLEITEGVVLQRTEQVLQTLGTVRALGCQLLLDDFGTGYSSLSYLHRFPVDVVKIDRSFVSRLGVGDTASTAIVDAVIRMARALGLSTVAEGVETPEQLRELEHLGCDRAQGYLFSPPLPPERLQTELLAGGGAARRAPR